MRILVFAALLSGDLCAQTPPVKPVEPAPAPQAAVAVQAPDLDALEQNRELPRRFVLPPTSIIVTPEDTGQLVLPGIAPYVSGHVTLAPGRTCSIPLIDVGPKGGFTGDPKIVLPGSKRLANLDHMPVIQGSPPCAQVKR
jgi:hypothetical protein